jgi:hypothetical protein
LSHSSELDAFTAIRVDGYTARRRINNKPYCRKAA